ncbi:hypothetical protein PMNALOAF_2372 [Methylobacterium adhaesivum]|uniref:glycosyltransferase n=1 Tax=Methylobacterium adhaesivum TaxID=333297 RepID=UPI001EDE2ABC|nr:glycosyltransferase [Methylobacterium adhaesivum]GJD31119.1 hypothetical protein PMNALOAF_2372 [Methylobacterium adhaesivum]
MNLIKAFFGDRSGLDREPSSDYDLLARSGLFDATYYLRENPDVAEAKADPIVHYLTVGFLEGREPSAFFDGTGYREGDVAIKASGINPLVHWLRDGAAEGRAAPLRRAGPATSDQVKSDYALVARSGLFDIRYYLANNPDVAASGEDPIVHYLQFGYLDGRAPSAFFDGNAYRDRNADVREARLNPLVHWLRLGSAEGRMPPVRDGVAEPGTDYALVARSGLFDEAYYLRSNPDVAESGLDPIVHYLTSGFREGREPAAFFDGKTYAQRYPDVGTAGQAPLVHWMRVGKAEGRRAPIRDAAATTAGTDYDLVARSGLFDPAYYLRANPEVAAAGLDPISHYLQTGHASGRQPSEFFDGAAYLASHSEVAAAGLNPLVHWLRVGAEEGRPAPVATRNRRDGTDYDLVARSGWFDPAYYLRQNPDVAEAGLDPISHYLTGGFREGREPSAFFDGRGYGVRYPDVLLADIPPLVHWLRVGLREDREAPFRPDAERKTGLRSDYEVVTQSGLFDPAFYLRENPDVAEAGLDPVSHYLAGGFREGREPSAFFDGRGYRARYPDVVVADIAPLLHWLRFGLGENREAPIRRDAGGEIGPGSDYGDVAASGLFDRAFYLRDNPDVAEAGIDPVVHYLTAGFREGREPAAFFDGRGYRARYPDVVLADIAPLLHWLRVGLSEGREAPFHIDAEAEARRHSDYAVAAQSGLFDRAYYLRENADVAAAGLDPVAHYVTSGFREGREPSEFFDGRAYHARYPDAADTAPLVHWMRTGLAEGRRPPIRGAVPPGTGIDSDYELVARSGLFDVGYYLRTYPDVAADGMDPIAHYLSSGHLQEREPSLFFHGQTYLERYPDVRASAINPLVHWLRTGTLEGREAPLNTLGIKRKLTLRDLCEPVRTEATPGFDDPAFRLSVVTPSFNTEPAHLQELFQTLLNQTYAGWRWIIVDNGSERPDTLHALRRIAAADERVSVTFAERNLGIAGGTNHAIAQADGTHVALVDHDDLLPRTVFEEIWKAVRVNHDADLIYTDECKISDDGELYDVVLKPGWSPALLENTMYLSHLTVYRREFMARVGAFRPEFDGTQDYDYSLRASRHVAKAIHVPVIGYVWRASPSSTATSMTTKSYSVGRQETSLIEFARDRDPAASVSPGFGDGFWRTHYTLPETPPLLSYVIPTGAGSRVVRERRINLILNCIDSFESKDFYPNREYVIVHNGDLSEEQQARLAEIPGIRLVHYEDRSLNIARKLNIGVAAAEGELVCLLNDDVEAITSRGGEELVAFLLAHADVGMIGPLCLFENGTVQHNGVILLEQGPSHAGLFVAPSHAGATGNLLQCRREVFGVTGAMAIVRRADYQALGGFDERFPLNYNDVDFCLRLRESGRTCVVDPGVRVYHYESASKTGTYRCEKEALYARWPGLRDPYFNQGFDQRDPTYRVLLRPERAPVETDPAAFENWLDRHIAWRIRNYPAPGTIRFSLCVPVYDQPAAFLEEMLQSCLLQTYENREIVIVDDGSTRQDTLTWLAKVEASGHARVIRHEKNVGIAGANRTWLAAAEGDVLVPLDADDYLTIDALQVMAHWIERYPDGRVFYSDEFKSDPSSIKASPFFKPAFDPFLSTNCCFETHLMAWRRDLLLEIDAYGDDRATWCHDWDAIGRAWAAGYEPVHVPELLYAWRINPGSTASAETGDKPAALASQKFVLDRLVSARGRADAVCVRPNEAGQNTGMWSLRPRRALEGVMSLRAEDAWRDGGAALRAAADNGAEWIFLRAGDASSEADLSELSALPAWDDRVDVVSGLLTDAGGTTLKWSGAFFCPDGTVLDPYLGRAFADSYHGQIHTQRCVDVAAPTNVLIRTGALRRVLRDEAGPLTSDRLMILLGLDAVRGGRLVAVTPYLRAVWVAAPGLTLPLDREGILNEAKPELLASRWYDGRLSSDRPYGIEPRRWGR